MSIHVSKFGGTSLADAAQIAKVRAIVEADPRRRYVVPSAPGRRGPDDHKVTDLLYLCHEHARQGLAFDEVFAPVAQRYHQIANRLGVELDLTQPLAAVQSQIADRAGRGHGADYAASRGEYLIGLILASLLGHTFVDAAEIIYFDDRGRTDRRRTYAAIAERLRSIERAVIPGFYGSAPDNSVRTFSRGGSDITGALVARGVGATLYENWTDVSGLLMADPGIVPNPKSINVLTYRELRELAYMGAGVLHNEAIFHLPPPPESPGPHTPGIACVQTSPDSIPVNIRNTNRPEDPGTMIVCNAEPPAHTGAITGIAGKKDFTVIALEKALMNTEIGFGRRVLSVLERNGVNFEHLPSGIDTMSLVIDDDRLRGKLDDVLEGIRQECQPDSIQVYPNMALIATVGRGMTHTPGTAAKLFAALADAGVNVRMIDQGSSELNIIVGVEADDFETAVRTIYDTFVES